MSKAPEHWLATATAEVSKLEKTAKDDPKAFYSSKQSDMSSRLAELAQLKVRLDALHRHPNTRN